MKPKNKFSRACTFEDVLKEIDRSKIKRRLKAAFKKIRVKND
jgi:hypothetical protein